MTTLVLMWADAVRRYGDRPAVQHDDVTLSYAELDRYANTIAWHLHRRGLRPEDRVAVCLPRGVDVLAAILGVLKAGGAYVAVDPRYPDARRDLMVEASGAVTTLTEAELPDRAAAEDGPPAVEVGPAHAACVLFTSGSSGTPKAVVLEHRNVCGFARNSSLPPLRSTDRMGQISSLSFDAFHYELWCAVAHGAAIVVLPTIPEMLAADLRKELRRRRITAMLVPTMAVNHVVREDRDAFSSLRVLCTGGDVILPGTCRELLAGDFSGEFHNLYGPTEATTACTAYPVVDVPAQAESVPIGHPVAGARVYVLDEALRPVAADASGQLYVGGHGVGRGYLGNPGLTAERFLPDPFQPGGRMYATGDLARRRPDGALEFLGRADRQVKVRGYRVELGEVERVLGGHPQVREVAVLTAGDGQDRALVAVVTRHGPVHPDELRAYAAELMPQHMVPSAFLVVAEMPASDHGKRDWQALERLCEAERARRSAHAPPSTPGEVLLAGIWAELLAVEVVGADDDFFGLGGNSMMAFRAQQRIRRQTGVVLDFRDIFARPVLRELAAFLDQQAQPEVVA